MRSDEKTAARNDRRGDVVGGLKVIALYNDDAKLSAVYRVTDADVVEFDGPTLIQVRAKLTHRKVR